MSDTADDFDIPKLASALAGDVEPRLRDWFAAHMPASRRLTGFALQAPASGAGFSGDTHIVNLHWDEGGREQAGKFVLRAELTAANNPESSFRNMVAVQKVLGDIPELRVPKVWFAEDDPAVIGGPFFVMEHVEGRIAQDNPPFAAHGWFAEATPETRTRIYRSGLEVLSRLHALDWRPLGLDFLLRTGNAPTQTGRHLERMIEIYDRAMDGKRRELASEAIAWLRANLPATEELRISWGDARMGNMLFRDDACVAAIDWEMATLAEPAADVSWWLFFERSFTEGRGIRRPPGMPDRDTMFALYEEIAGRPLANIRFHELFAGFRSHVIATHMYALWERAGMLLWGPEGSIDSNPPADTLAQMLKES